MNYDKVKHLEFIQNAINRMANTSFLLKGWTVTLVVALLALAAKDSNPKFVIIALFPTLSFWELDAYYLRQERLFRMLYETICSSKGEELESIIPFSLDTSKYKGWVNNWFITLFSRTIIAVHGIILALIIILIIILFVHK